MQNLVCPLCKNKKYIIIDKINKKQIINDYNKELNIDTEYLFKGCRDTHLEKRICSECGINYFSENISGDNLFYSELSKKNEYYSVNKWEFDIAIEKLLEQKNINSLLEIGCGGGFFLEKIKNNFDEVYGSEFNENALKISKEKGLTIYNCSLDKIDKTFDAIVTFQVFEHINDIKEIIETSYKLLNNNGMLLISVPNSNSNGYLKYVYDILNLPPHHLLGWSKKSFFYLENFGFKVVDYIEEPLNISCYYSYLYNKFIKSKKHNLFLKNMLKIGVLTISLIKYTMLSKETEIKGHSHMIILRKY